ncbi:MAG: metallophosphoesterase [Flavobacteriaceae bacterium]|nr:metallophosphoesterase [Flavobacteriaceae bacterium]
MWYFSLNMPFQPIFIIVSLILLEIYVYQGIKTIIQKSSVRKVYLGITTTFYIIISYFLFDFKVQNISIIFSMAMIFLLPKVLITLFLLLDDILRFGQFIINKITKTTHHYPERRKFLGQLSLGLSALLSGLVVDGIIWGKYRHTLRKIKLKFENLPKSFEGYTIVQISDVHSGSFNNPSKLQHAIDLINEQNADLVLFTGDMVNNYAEEFEPFIPLFSQIKAKDGKFSVLGNHDYGIYARWDNILEKHQNVPKLIKFQKEAGFEVLRNEHRVLEKNGETIYLLGVENWGEPPFPQFGDLDKASKGLPEDTIKILMSHDPTHFDRIVKHHPANIQLTLSGHTHGMQFGIDLKNVKWSPVQYRYSKWADLYKSNGKYLYINRGFGVLGFHGRVGIYPEITLIELQNKV